MLLHKISHFFNNLELVLDKFFDTQKNFFYNVLERIFIYIFRETRSGVFGLFNTPKMISKAAKRAKEDGYTGFDCLTPFPVHGLEFDMGLSRSRIPYIAFIGGVLGLFAGFSLQFIAHDQVITPIFSYFDGFPNFRSYPLNIGGKPTFSWPAMIPICFELTVLFGGVSTVIGFIMIARLHHPFRPVLHPSITDDKFCLWLPSDSAVYKEDTAIKLLKELGATEITRVSPDGNKAIESSVES